MNEYYFLIQVLLILLFSYGALKLGEAALTTSVAVQGILANLFVLKQITFLSFTVTCSDAFMVGSMLSLNLLREYFGREASKKAINIAFFFMAFVALLSQIHLKFIPSPFDTAHAAYAHLLTPAPRLLIASLTVFYLVQRLDVRLFGWISTLLPRSNFALRSSLSLSTSQLVATLLFSFLGLYGMVAKIGHIVLVSYLIKLLVVLTLAPLTAFFKRSQRHV